MAKPKIDVFAEEVARSDEEELPSIAPGVQVTKEYDFPHVVANYMSSNDPRFEGNILALALPEFPKERDELIDQLLVRTKPAKNRTLTRLERVMELPQFLRGFYPLPRVAQLAERMYSRMRESYIGREPYTKAYGERMQIHYENSKLALTQNERETALKNCIALVGLPGAGKSSAVAHACRIFPPIIHHPEWAIWQIPVLRLSMPYKARSEHALAIRIIRSIAKRYPPGHYIKLYLARRPPHVDALVDAAIHLIHKHCVGLVVIDDSHKSEDGVDSKVLRTARSKRAGDRTTPMPRLLDLLFWCVDSFGVPLLLVGTSELKVTLDETMSGLRRTVGGGLQVWKNLDWTPRAGQRASDFDVFLALAWSDLRLPKPPNLAELRHLILMYTYAIPDVIMSLLHDVQAQALEDGLDTFDENLVHLVAGSDALRAVTELCLSMHEVDTSAEARARLLRVKELAATFDLQPEAAAERPEPKDTKGALFEFAQLMKQQRRRTQRQSSTMPTARSSRQTRAGARTGTSPAAKAAQSPHPGDLPVSSHKDIGK